MRTTLFTLATLVYCTTAIAQKPMLPSQIVNARTVFLASGFVPIDGKGSINQAIAYTAIAEGLEKQDGLKRVSSPHEADLALTESIAIDFSSVSGGSSFPRPRLCLRISDPNTNVLLWELDQPLQSTYIANKRSRQQFDAAVTTLFQQFDQLRHGMLPGSDSTGPASTKENQ